MATREMCHGCGGTYTRCPGSVTCDTCGSTYCCKECYEDEKPKVGCRVCGGGILNDRVMLKMLLDALGMSKDDARRFIDTNFRKTS